MWAAEGVLGPLVPIWDDRSFYDFVATSRAFASRSFRHREVFGQVGFGTGGWDTDFPNSMLEILRVVVTNQDEDQRLVMGGVEQMPRRLWRRAAEHMAHWPPGTTLEKLHDGAPRPGVARIAPTGDGRFSSWTAGATCAIIRRARHLPVLAAHHPHRHGRAPVLASALDGAGPHPLHAVVQDLRHGRPRLLERARPATGRHRMSTTLTDRLTRGTYLFDHGPAGRVSSACPIPG